MGVTDGYKRLERAIRGYRELQLVKRVKGSYKGLQGVTEG